MTPETRAVRQDDEMEQRLEKYLTDKHGSVPLYWVSALAAAFARQEVAAERQRAWISMSEREPETAGWCLVVYRGTTQDMAAQLNWVGFPDDGKKEWGWADCDADPAPKDEISHWQPLPEPPAIRKLGGTE